MSVFHFNRLNLNLWEVDLAICIFNKVIKKFLCSLKVKNAALRSMESQSPHRAGRASTQGSMV